MPDNTDKTVNEISRIINGLYYMSESDYPFESSIVKAGSEKEIIQQLIPATEKITTVSLLDLFKAPMNEANYQERDKWISSRYRELYNLLTNMKNVTVYKAGSRQIDIIIVAELQTGGYIVLTTKAIET
jgi:hypothetical protein